MDRESKPRLGRCLRKDYRSVRMVTPTDTYSRSPRVRARQRVVVVGAEVVVGADVDVDVVLDVDPEDVLVVGAVTTVIVGVVTRGIVIWVTQ